ncbi:sensor histidine kinase [Chondrinema litorale]|uniref:sensor histidine kinase n=1 Tax=Chondrinema litorale TaxID=2994555 RepID=UPI0025431910|nr:HAMP domain-containing sensor histidine kinase [Chondrinema litorale]UZR95997.1 HAMP domain-containing sensor histidine kinase [Chondrinema litorale]
MISIYQNKEKLKWIIVAIALLIGLFSLFYTNSLVQHLADREKKQINLFASALEFVVTSASDEELNFVFTEIIHTELSVPCIVTDDKGEPIHWRNIDVSPNLSAEEENKLLLKHIEKMKEVYEPIEMDLGPDFKQYIYYDNSEAIVQLRYFSYMQITGIAILSVLAYFVFSSTRRAEQNRVWVGLAKETAHQLGTPISSLMAWIEFFKADENFDQSIIPELTKDLQRLEMITARFSSIGSEPSLVEENVLEAVENIVNYLQKRVSTKVKFSITPKIEHDMMAKINIPLFEWIIENICKNAVDAMSGVGKIDIYLRNSKDHRFLYIDISDTGKGIPKSKIKSIFQPGFTTKKRGWGLGLTLVKRIVENYHRGRIFVLKSEIDVGTTFRISFPKD